MDLPFGRSVYRLRAQSVEEPYSGEPKPGDWREPLVREIPQAFVAQSSTAMVADATREQALEEKSLYCEPDTDLAKGDRVFVGTFVPPLPEGAGTVPVGTVMQGALYSIDGLPPEGDVNPFTGWRPTREVPLTRGVG